MELSSHMIDWCAQMQDEVLDAQHEWLAKLPITDELRWEIFDHLCAVSGEIMDRMIQVQEV